MRIGKYILNQLQDLTAVSCTPILQKINDLKSKVTLEFTVKDTPVNLTVSDLYLSTLSPKLEDKLNSPRNEFIKSMYREITSGVKESIEDRDDLIDFDVQLSEEVKEKINNLVPSLVTSELYPITTELSYITSLGTPVFAYNLTKSLIKELQIRQKPIPDELVRAVKSPQEYFNPNVVNDLEEEYEDIIEKLDNTEEESISENIPQVG